MSRSVKQDYPPSKWKVGDKVAMIPQANGNWLAVDPKAISIETIEANNGFITTVVEDK